MASIGFIGAGNMATAIINGIISKNVVSFADIWASDVDFEKLRDLKNQLGLNITTDNQKLTSSVDILILSIKPQIFDSVLNQIKNCVKENILIVSIAAGIKIKKITDFLGDVPVIRVMPNTPALVGEGAAGIFANDKAKSKLEKIKKIFSAVGKTVVVQNEEMLDVVTALSGSGPAYFFLLMEEMIEAGVKLGMDREFAKKLVLQTALGASKLAVNSPDTPDVLRKKVTSPGGTTEAALNIFADKNFDQIIKAGIKRAAERSIELSQ